MVSLRLQHLTVRPIPASVGPKSRQRTLTVLHALYNVCVDRTCVQIIVKESQHLLSGGSITELEDRMALLSGGGTAKDCLRRSAPPLLAGRRQAYAIVSPASKRHYTKGEVSVAARRRCRVTSTR